MVAIAPKTAQKTKSSNVGEMPKAPFELILAVDSDNARTNVAKIEELAEGIKLNGLLEPIGLRVIDNPELTEDEKGLLGLGADDDSPPRVYRVVYGFRRYYAIQLLRSEDASAFEDGVPFVPQTKETSDDIFSNLEENLSRDGLLPAELAARLTVMKTDMGIPVDTIASRLRISKGYVNGLIKLKQKLIGPAWDKFATGELTYDVAMEIAKGSAEDQATALEAALTAVAGQEGKKKKRGAKKAVKASRGENTNTRPSAKVLGGEYAKRLEELGVKKAMEAPDNFSKGVLLTLEFAMGVRKSIPTAKAPAPKK